MLRNRKRILRCGICCIRKKAAGGVKIGWRNYNKIAYHGVGRKRNGGRITLWRVKYFNPSWGNARIGIFGFIREKVNGDARHTAAALLN